MLIVSEELKQNLKKKTRLQFNCVNDECNQALCSSKSCDRIILRLVLSYYWLLLKNSNPDFSTSFFPRNEQPVFDFCLNDKSKSGYLRDFKDFLNGFQKPGNFFFNEADFIRFIENIDEQSLAEIFQELKKSGIKSTEMKWHWLLFDLFVHLQDFLLKIEKGKLSYIYGLKQLIFAKFYEDYYHVNSDIISSEHASEDNLQIREEAITEEIRQEIGFTKSQIRMTHLQVMPNESIKAVTIDYLANFTNFAGKIIRKAGNGYDGITDLAENGLLKKAIQLLSRYNLFYYNPDSSFLSDIDHYSDLFDLALRDCSNHLNNIPVSEYFASLRRICVLKTSPLLSVKTCLNIDFYSYLLFHCAEKLFADYSLNNTGNITLKNLQMRVILKGRDLFEAAFNLPPIQPKSSLSAQKEIILPENYLKKVEESEVLSVEIQISKDKQAIHLVNHEIDIFPWNQFFYNLRPEAIAGFVTPGSKAIREAITRVKDSLKNGGLDQSTDGYQKNDRKRVESFAAAAYYAIKKLGITYSNAPFSASDTGQKVRAPFQVIRERQGTCIDLSVLLASILEAMGLNPVIVFCYGHAFTGCYLTNTYQKTLLSKESIEKLLDANELLLFDSSSSAQNRDFQKAKAIARRALEKFECMVDVTSAHKGNFKPMSLNESELQASEHEEFDVRFKVKLLDNAYKDELLKNSFFKKIVISDNDPAEELVNTFYPNENARIVSFMALLKKEMERKEFTETAMANACTVFSELLANALNHGCKGVDNGKVDVKCQINNFDARFIVRDYGNGFDYEHTVKKIQNQALNTGPDSRGLFLIKNLSSCVYYSEGGRLADVVVSGRNSNKECSAYFAGMQYPRTAILKIIGPVHIHSIPEIKECTSQLINNSYVNIILDCSQITYVDSAGLGIFIYFRKVLQNQSGQLILLNVNAYLDGIFQIIQFPLPCTDDVEEAVALIRKGVGKA